MSRYSLYNIKKIKNNVAVDEEDTSDDIGITNFSVHQNQVTKIGHT